MKKTVSLILAFLMVFSCVAVPAYADEFVTISAVKDVVNKVHNDGYYDAGGAEKFETQGDWFIARAGDWTSYDISALPAGLYSFSIKAGANSIYAKVTVEIDGNSIISKKALANTVSYTSPKEQDLGKITIPEGAQRMKFICSGSNAFFFESFTLTKIAPPEIKSFTTNAGIDGDVVPWGADVFTLTMGAALDTTSVSETTVMIKDENDTALSADVSATGNTVTLELNESLKPGSKYEIVAQNLKGTESQVLTTPSVKKFSTTDSASTEGTAYIEVLSYSKNENTIKADGVVKSSSKKGINGRKVYLNIKAPNEDASTVATAVTETKDGENGYFSITYTIPDGYDKAGKHQLIVTSDCVKDSFEESFTYYTEAIETEITQAFSGLTTTQAAESALSSYIDYLDMTQKEIEQLVPDLSALYEMMLGQTFTTASDAISAVKNNIYTAAIMQSDDKDDIIAILDDEEKAASIVDFNTVFWNALSVDAKNNVATKALDFEADIAEKLNNAVKAELMLQEEITKAEAEFAQVKVQSGELAEVKATLKSEISDVYSFTFDFKYDESIKSAFDSAEVVVPAGFDYETTNESGIYSVEAKATQGLSDDVKTAVISGDILTLKLKTGAKMIGTHKLTVSGSVKYHPAVIKDETAHIEEEIKTIGNPGVTVTEVEKLVVNIQKPVNFFDNPSAGGSNIGNVELAGVCIVSRVGEWTEYDISALSAGEYEVSFFYGSVSDVKFDALVDGSAPFALNSLKGTGGYGVHKDVVLGHANLSGSQKIFRLSNTGSAASYVGDITFTKINPMSVENIYANETLVNPDTDKVYRGTDRISVEFNNQLMKDTVDESKVVFTDASGAVIDCELNVDDKKLLIDLKQTLDYGKEYTLKITGLGDRFSQTMTEPYTTIISTYDKDTDSGLSKIEIEKCEATEESFTLKATVTSSNNVGISGRVVKVFAKAEGETEYKLWAEGTSGKDGEITLSYTFSEDQKPGKYYLNIYAEYEEKPFEDDVYYFDAELSKQIAEDFYMLSDGAAVAAKLKENAVKLGIDYDKAEKELTDISYVTNKMANKEYEKAIEVKDDFVSLVVLEKVNQAADADKVTEIIDDAKTFSDAGEIQRDKWDALEEAEQKTVAENIRKGGRIEKTETLLSLIDEEINKILQEKYSFTETKLSVSTQNISVGQGAVFSFKSEKSQSNVVGIHIEIKYTEAEKALFEATPILELSKKLKDLDVNVTNSEGKIVYDITVKQSGKAGDMISTVDFANEIMTLSYITTDGMEGTYNPEVSGYISHHAESAKDKQTVAYFADVPFTVDANPVFTISASGGSGDYEGGGGTPGGNLGLGGGSGSGGSSGGGITGGGSTTIIPPTTTEGVNKLPFDDIENISWAKDAICALADKGIVSGKDKKTFAPNDNVTRAEFCKMIALAFGIVDASAECDFGDVESSAWYYTYIASAKKAGIINGRENNTFSPDATITREEMATIALRAINKETKLVTEKFADDSSISDYAKDAVYTLKELGIINGVGENMFSPRAMVTRAMAAKVIYMLLAV